MVPAWLYIPASIATLVILSAMAWRAFTAELNSPPTFEDWLAADEGEMSFHDGDV